jgi:hypothetical protein
LVTHGCREAFREYVDWLDQPSGAARAARALIRHVEFFVEVERRGLDLDNGEILLRELGTPFLRRYLMVTRWLEEIRSCNIKKLQRANASDSARLKTAIEVLPKNTEERRLAEKFLKDLSDAVITGAITIRTARLSMRPAVDLLKVVRRKKALPLTQWDLIEYLKGRPGQRAAIARFVGFIRKTMAIDLTLPKIGQISQLPFSGSDQAVRLHLMADVRGEQFQREWIRLMLVHLHWLSERTAGRVASKAVVSEVKDGYRCCVGADIYWVPRPPCINRRDSCYDGS